MTGQKWTGPLAGPTPDACGFRTRELGLGDDPGGSGSQNDAFIITANSQTLFQFNTQLAGGFAGQALKNRGVGRALRRAGQARHPAAGRHGRAAPTARQDLLLQRSAGRGRRSGPADGFVAQEAEKVFPQWVGTLSSRLKTLSITGFEAMTVEALRDLRDETRARAAAIEADKDAQIASLRRDKDELADRVARLEALVEKLNAK